MSVHSELSTTTYLISSSFFGMPFIHIRKNCLYSDVLLPCSPPSAQKKHYNDAEKAHSNFLKAPSFPTSKNRKFNFTSKIKSHFHFSAYCINQAPDFDLFFKTLSPRATRFPISVHLFFQVKYFSQLSDGPFLYRRVLCNL